MNQAWIAGHLGADPEVRFTSSGQKVTTLRVAAKVRRGGKDETIWWRVSVWGEQFDKMIPYFKKGSSIIVFGELNKPEIFTDREGRPQISMSMTAINLSFSPFGRPESSSGQHEGSDSEAAFAGAGAFTGSGHAGSGNAGSSQSQGQNFGQGKPSAPAFSDDEVPF